MEVLEEIRKKIEEADMVLWGIGREFNIRREEICQSDLTYQKLKLSDSPLTDLEKEWIEFTLMQRIVADGQSAIVKERLELYDTIAKYLSKFAKENYFVVTTCNDDIIYGSKLDNERMVAPCGTLAYMKCDKGCFKYVYKTEEVYNNISKIISSYEAKEFSDAEDMWSELKEAMPQCPMCKQVMSVNMFKTNNYSEEGYREKWEEYMAWLQKTLNRKLVMLELGEGFDTPTVIRWPFEKVAAVNNKATLIRVNEKFWQISEDIEAKAIPVKMRGMDFIKNM